MKLYLVMGVTGEYEDRREWPVMAYPWAMSADAHANQANRWATQTGIAWEDMRLDWLGDRIPDNPWDPGMPRPQWNGVKYFRMTIPYAQRRFKPNA